MKTLDLTPTWAALVPAFVLVLTNGTQEGRDSIRVELARMAALADLYAAHVRAQDAAAIDAAKVAPPVAYPLSDALASARLCLAAYPESDIARLYQGKGAGAARDLRAELADLSDATARELAAPAVGEVRNLRTGIASALAALTSPHYGELENLADHAADARAILENLTNPPDGRPSQPLATLTKGL